MVEFCVSGDFSENYSFLTQVATHEFHLLSKYFTRHYSSMGLYYYSENNVTTSKHSSFTIISEINSHGAFTFILSCDIFNNCLKITMSKRFFYL